MQHRLKQIIGLLGGLFLLVGGTTAVLLAQEGSSEPRFRRLSVEEGLSNPAIQAIVQDQRGFIWLATEGGLNRYDGYRFVVYKHQPDNPNSPSDNVINALVADKDGNLWLGTEQGGLNKFEVGTQTFTRYKSDENDPKTLASNEIESLYMDPSGILWVGLLDDGLNRFDPATGEATRYAFDGDDPTTLRGEQVTTLLMDRNGLLWIGTENNGASSFDPATETFTSYPFDEGEGSLLGAEVLAFYEDAAGTLWVGTDDGGLHQVDVDNGTFTLVATASDSPITLEGVDAIAVDEAGRWWLGEGGGLVQFDMATRQAVIYRHDPLNFASLSNNNVNVLLLDRSGMLWVGTEGGVNLLNPRQLAFTHYQSDLGQENSLAHNFVRSTYVDRAGMVWVGTSGGIGRFDPTLHTFTNYHYNPDDPSQLPFERVYAIVEDENGAIWLADREERVARFEPATETFTLFEHNPDDPTTIGSERIRSLFANKDGIVWVATDDGIVSRFEQATGQFTRFVPDGNNGRSGQAARAMAQGPDGKLWLGLESGGIELFDPASNTAVFYNYNNQLSDLFQDKDVELLLPDQRGYLWLGTDEAGLIRFNLADRTIKQYTDEVGLLNNAIAGLINDNQGNLWIATKLGFSKLNVTSETFTNFGTQDGLLGTDFQEAIAYDPQTDTIYAGHTSGLTIFHPADLVANSHTPPIVLTDFRIFNQSIKPNADSLLPQAIESTATLTLSANESIFSFEFSALDFTLPSRNRYAYRMVGLETAWNEVDSNQRYVTYTNLPSGDYTFEVRGSNNDGVWNEAETAVSITILPPWWQTWWFRTLVGLLIVGLAVGWNRWRVRQVAQRNRELEAMVAERTVALETSNEQLAQVITEVDAARAKAEIANHAKSDFLSNMSHELRTPLNGILGYTQILSRDETLSPQQAVGLNVIEQSGNHLLTLINDILDISKIEARKLELEPIPMQLRSFLDGLVAIMQLRAEQKGLTFVFEVDEQLPAGVLADEKRLRQILINLLGNGIKFTPFGWVVLRVEQRPTINGHAALRFEVQDSGVGIAKDDLERIFRPFEQVGDRQSRAEGTGLGLAICQQLVAAMGGELQVLSEPGLGSRFWFDVTFPLADAEQLRPATADNLQKIIGYAGPRRKILVVDDKQHNRDLLVDLLQPLGFETAVATDGSEAIEVAHTFQPDAIFMDLVMPQVTGFEATQRLRSLPKLAKTYIIAISASVFERAKVQSAVAGCDAFLPKPFVVEDLLAVLGDGLGLSWEYAAPATPTHSKPDLTAVLPPNADTLNELYTLAMAGDLFALQKVVRSLAEQDAQLVPFAQHVQALATAFDDEGVLAFLNNYRSKP